MRSPRSLTGRCEETFDKIADLSLPQQPSLTQFRFTALTLLEPCHSNGTVLAKTFDPILFREPSPQDRERFAHDGAVLAGERLPERHGDCMQSGGSGRSDRFSEPISGRICSVD
jgi:hypothetical protein